MSRGGQGALGGTAGAAGRQGGRVEGAGESSSDVVVEERLAADS
jgi:hypothetical protein